MSMMTFAVVALCSLGLAGRAQDPPADTPAVAKPNTTAPPTEVTAWTTDPLLRQVPETPDELAARLELAKNRIDVLTPLAQPADPPATDPAAIKLREARSALLAEWQAYQTQLQALQAVRERLATRSGEAFLKELTHRIEDWRQREANLRSRTGLTELNDEYRQADAQLDALSEQQTQRAQQLATGLKQQREAATAEQATVNTTRQQLPPAPAQPAATEPADWSLEVLQRRLLDVQAARLDLTLRTLTHQRELTELESKQTQQELEPLQAYVTALQKRVATLTEAERTADLKTIKRQEARATPGYEKTFLALQTFRQEVLLTYFQNKKLDAALKERFPKSEFDRLKDRIASLEQRCSDMAESLAQRGGQEATEAHTFIRDARLADAQQRQAMQAKLTQTLTELHQLRLLRERSLQRFAQRADQLTAELASAEPAERTRIESEVTSLRASMVQTMDQTIKEVHELDQRLRDGIKLLEDQVTALRTREIDLQRKALRRRESGLVGIEWTRLVQEVRQLLDLTPPTAPTGTQATEDKLAAELQLTPTGTREEVVARWQSLTGEFRQVTRRAWLWLGAAAALLLLAAGLVRQVAKQYARQIGRTLDDHSDTSPEGAPAERLSARINLFGWRVVRGLAWPAALVALAFLGPSVLHLSPAARSIVVTGLTSVASLMALLVIVQRFFEPGAQHRRVPPCSDPVARRYRNWLLTMLLLSAVLLLPPLALQLLGTAPHLRSALGEVYKTILLLLLALFLLRRDRVLGILGEPREHWSWTLAHSLYPLVFLTVGALLLLQVIGYGVLVTYVGNGLLATLLILLITGTVVEYVADLLIGYAGPDEPPTPAPATGRRRRRTAALPIMTGPVYLPHVARLGGLLVRLLGVATAAVLVLQVWGVSVNEYPVNWRTIGIGALVVLAASVIDRVLLAAIRALRVAGRIPQSTENLLRRWLRILLVLVVVLLLIALAGHEITGIWAFLSTLLGLIAVGFVAVWSVLSNVTSTLIILIWRPFNIGEHVELLPEGIAGEVVDINFMYTLLRTDADEHTAVPNSQFLQKFIRRRAAKRPAPVTLAEQLDRQSPLDA